MSARKWKKGENIPDPATRRGTITAPQDNERYFALTDVSKINFEGREGPPESSLRQPDAPLSRKSGLKMGKQRPYHVKDPLRNPRHPSIRWRAM